MTLSNETAATHNWLREMYDDAFFPNFLVDKVKAILTGACSEIETQKPTTEEGLLKITHHATERLNDLQQEFWDKEIEIETGAREAIGAEFEFIARNYGFEGVDIEDVIAPRDW